MKVVQVVPSIGAESSGPSYSVPGLCRGLYANRVNVELHFLDEVPEHLSFAAYEVRNYPRHDRLGLGYSPEMLQGLKTSAMDADILQNNGLWMMPNVYPVHAVKGTRCKLVVAPRGTLAAWSLRKGWFKKKLFGVLFQNRVLHQADMFHATSEKEYEEIRAQGYHQPVAIVPIGMDIPAIEQSNNRAIEQSPKWGMPGLKKVVFFGRLHKVKAVDNLVLAWAKLCAQQSFEQLNNSHNRTIDQWELLIAGPDCGIRGELERLIAEKKIPRVSFVGEINGAAKYEFLSSADLYVLPSYTENFGVTVAEALACGTPVIVSKGTPWQGVETCGCIPQSNNRTIKQSNNSRCGWWVENVPEVLADTLQEALSLSDEARHQMGENGKAWIARDFSWSGIGAKMKQAYEWLLASDKEARPVWVRVD